MAPPDGAAVFDTDIILLAEAVDKNIEKNYPGFEALNSSLDNKLEEGIEQGKDVNAVISELEQSLDAKNLQFYEHIIWVTTDQLVKTGAITLKNVLKPVIGPAAELVMIPSIIMNAVGNYYKNDRDHIKTILTTTADYMLLRKAAKQTKAAFMLSKIAQSIHKYLDQDKDILLKNLDPNNNAHIDLYERRQEIIANARVMALPADLWDAAKNKGYEWPCTVVRYIKNHGLEFLNHILSKYDTQQSPFAAALNASIVQNMATQQGDDSLASQNRSDNMAGHVNADFSQSMGELNLLKQQIVTELQPEIKNLFEQVNASAECVAKTPDNNVTRKLFTLTSVATNLIASIYSDVMFHGEKQARKNQLVDEWQRQHDHRVNEIKSASTMMQCDMRLRNEKFLTALVTLPFDEAQILSRLSREVSVLLNEYNELHGIAQSAAVGVARMDEIIQKCQSKLLKQSDNSRWCDVIRFVLGTANQGIQYYAAQPGHEALDTLAAGANIAVGVCDAGLAYVGQKISSNSQQRLIELQDERDLAAQAAVNQHTVSAHAEEQADLCLNAAEDLAARNLMRVRKAPHSRADHKRAIGDSIRVSDGQIEKLTDKKGNIEKKIAALEEHEKGKRVAVDTILMNFHFNRAWSIYPKLIAYLCDELPVAQHEALLSRIDSMNLAPRFNLIKSLLRGEHVPLQDGEVARPQVVRDAATQYKKSSVAYSQAPVALRELRLNLEEKQRALREECDKNEQLVMQRSQLETESQTPDKLITLLVSTNPAIGKLLGDWLVTDPQQFQAMLTEKIDQAIKDLLDQAGDNLTAEEQEVIWKQFTEWKQQQSVDFYNNDFMTQDQMIHAYQSQIGALLDHSHGLINALAAMGIENRFVGMSVNMAGGAVDIASAVSRLVNSFTNMHNNGAQSVCLSSLMGVIEHVLNPFMLAVKSFAFIFSNIFCAIWPQKSDVELLKEYIDQKFSSLYQYLGENFYALRQESRLRLSEMAKNFEALQVSSDVNLAQTRSLYASMANDKVASIERDFQMAQPLPYEASYQQVRTAPVNFTTVFPMGIYSEFISAAANRVAGVNRLSGNMLMRLDDCERQYGPFRNAIYSLLSALTRTINLEQSYAYNMQVLVTMLRAVSDMTTLASNEGYLVTPSIRAHTQYLYNEGKKLFQWLNHRPNKYRALANQVRDTMEKFVKVKIDLILHLHAILSEGKRRQLKHDQDLGGLIMSSLSGAALNDNLREIFPDKDACGHKKASSAKYRDNHAAKIGLYNCFIHAMAQRKDFEVIYHDSGDYVPIIFHRSEFIDFIKKYIDSAAEKIPAYQVLSRHILSGIMPHYEVTLERGAQKKLTLQLIFKNSELKIPLFTITNQYVLSFFHSLPQRDNQAQMNFMLNLFIINMFLGSPAYVIDKQVLEGVIKATADSLAVNSYTRVRRVKDEIYVHEKNMMAQFDEINSIEDENIKKDALDEYFLFMFNNSLLSMLKPGYFFDYGERSLSAFSLFNLGYSNICSAWNVQANVASAETLDHAHDYVAKRSGHWRIKTWDDLNPEGNLMSRQLAYQALPMPPRDSDDTWNTFLRTLGKKLILPSSHHSVSLKDYAQAYNRLVATFLMFHNMPIELVKNTILSDFFKLPALDDCFFHDDQYVITFDTHRDNLPTPEACAEMINAVLASQPHSALITDLAAALSDMKPVMAIFDAVAQADDYILSEPTHVTLPVPTAQQVPVESHTKDRPLQIDPTEIPYVRKPFALTIRSQADAQAAIKLVEVGAIALNERLANGWPLFEYVTRGLDNFSLARALYQVAVPAEKTSIITERMYVYTTENGHDGWHFIEYFFRYGAEYPAVYELTADMFAHLNATGQLQAYSDILSASIKHGWNSWLGASRIECKYFACALWDSMYSAYQAGAIKVVKHMLDGFELLRTNQASPGPGINSFNYGYKTVTHMLDYSAIDSAVKQQLEAITATKPMEHAPCR